MSSITICKNNMSATVLTFGATLQSLIFDGTDVVCGYETEDEYKNGTCYYGATVGRVCNRTKGGVINVNGSMHQVTINEPARQNSLHGGMVGFSHREWSVLERGDSFVTLTLTSPDGDEGYPAAVNACVTYAVSDDTLRISMRATPDALTPICLTNHSYFNLFGVASGKNILDTRLRIAADRFSLIDKNMNVIGRGEVRGTPLDFNELHTVGERIDDGFYQLILAGGYDHNLFLNGGVIAEGDKIGMEFDTTMPCIQLYTGNFCTEGEAQKYGTVGKKYCGFCLEPQFEPGFACDGSHIFTPDDPFVSENTYRFYKILR